MLRWGGGTAKGGKQLSFNGTYATGDKVVPKGSMWAKIPTPLIQEGDGPLGYIGYPIAPGCAELWGNQSAAMCSGMGDGTSSVDNLEIVDRVLIPKETPPGEYVLNWRYDCEVPHIPVEVYRYNVVLPYVPTAWAELVTSGG